MFIQLSSARSRKELMKWSSWANICEKAMYTFYQKTLSLEQYENLTTLLHGITSLCGMIHLFLPVYLPDVDAQSMTASAPAACCLVSCGNPTELKQKLARQRYLVLVSCFDSIFFSLQQTRKFYIRVTKIVNVSRVVRLSGYEISFKWFNLLI